MSLKAQVAPLSHAIDTDSGDKYIDTSRGWVRDRLNLRPNELDGNSLFNKKLKGNVLADMTLPAGVNKCIGWTADYKTESLIWFVLNSLGDHSIYRYFVNTDTVQKVWYPLGGFNPELEFEDAIIKASVADGRLYWINGSQQPKSFNIEKAVNFTNSLDGDSYTADDMPAKDIIFPLIKRPPQFAPEVAYTSVTEEAGLTVNFNNLRGKLFQFKYNFVYEDNQESAYSEISKVPLPEGDLTSTGEWVADFSTNNAIKVSLLTGNHLVKKINIAARIASEQNTGEFNIFKIIDLLDSDKTRIIEENSAYEVTFLNNEYIRNINTEIGTRYCDDVPLCAGDILLLDGKYSAMSMPTKGYDSVTGRLELTHSFENLDFGQSYISLPSTVITSTRTRADHRVTFPSPATLNSTYRIRVKFGDGTYIDATYPVLGADPGIEAIRDAIYGSLFGNDRLAHGQVSEYGTDGINITVIRSPGVSDVTGFTAEIELSSIASAISFKRGQYHKFGIVYNDEFGRYNIVNNDTTIFVPYPVLTDNYDQVSKISWSIFNRPPIEAASYRFVYQKNMSYTYFLDIVGVEFVSGGTGGVPAGHTFLKINQAIKKYKDDNNKTIISDYVWIKGDRAKMFYQSGRIGSTISDLSYEITGPLVREYDNLGPDPDPANPKLKESGFLVDGIIDNVSGIEIYRPNFEFEGNILYETGDSFPILDAGTAIRRHSSNNIIQSDDLTTPASGYFTFGDVYMRNRKTTDGSIVVEDSSYSDFYVSNCMNQGRAVIKIAGEVKQKELHRVVRSENYIEDSEYNLLNVFLAQTPFLTLSQSYGKITGMREVGEVLKVIQEHKETSVYVGKTAIKQADGSNLTVISDQVFGTINKAESLHGTSYPRSTASNDRNLYYFDQTTGDFIRSSPNGQMSLSEYYKLNTKFKAKADELRNSTNYTDVIVAVDSKYEEVLITFINGNESETYAFFEKEELKGFIFRAEIKPHVNCSDNFAWYGDKLFSFYQGKLWKHNIGNPNEFYGDTKTPSISFVVNAGAGDANKFSNIEMSSPDNVWDVQFDIAAGTNYPVQKSILRPAIIRTKENRLYSPILRNILGRNGVTELNRLYNGQEMTGETMTVTITSDDSIGDYTLKEVEIKFLTSK
jgi:hypothetical protein